MNIAKNNGKFVLTAFVLLLTNVIAPSLVAPNGVPVELRAITSSGSRIEIGFVTADLYGHFSYVWTLPAEDAYKTIAKFVGDDPPSTPTATNCTVSPTSVTVGNNVTVSGSVISTLSTPVSGVTVTLTYTKPDATTLTRTVTTGTDGFFNDIYTPSVAGSWSVKASWQGNPNHLGSTSFAATFKVTNPGAGIPMEYVYAAAATFIVIVAIVAYWYKKRK